MRDSVEFGALISIVGNLVKIEPDKEIWMIEKKYFDLDAISRELPYFATLEGIKAEPDDNRAIGGFSAIFYKNKKVYPV